MEEQQGKSPRFLYDPPVERRTLTLEREVPFQARAGYLGEQLGLEPASAERLLWHGGIFVNGARMDPKAKSGFKAGSTLEVYRFLREPEAIPVSDSWYLFENDDLLAVNKPAWLPVQATRASVRFSLEELLKGHTRNPSLMAVHRLDRQTSGALLFAKSGKAAARVMKYFADHRVLKRYFAVVSPPIPKKEWVVEGYLARDFKRHPQIYYRLIAKERPKARFSRTRFRHLGARGGRALVEAIPETGRTHQIRVHLTAHGSPILGDDLYGGAPSSAGRVQLHAYELRFPDWESPKAGEIKIKAPLPSDFHW